MHLRIKALKHYFRLMEHIQNKQQFETLCDWCTNIEPKLKPVIEKFGYPQF